MDIPSVVFLAIVAVCLFLAASVLSVETFEPEAIAHHAEPANGAPS